MRALLDINVLIALHDRDHIHHERAALWLETHISAGWASCPLTQNGCLRTMSQAAYSSPRQLTDVYLLALALHHGGRLVGFDQRIPLSAVRGAGPEHLVVL